MNAIPPLYGTSFRQPPSNLPLEQAVLGAIASNPKLADKVVEDLRPEHFYDPLNGRIYQEQCRRIASGGVADVTSLKTWFEVQPEFNEAGGLTYLAGLVSACPAPFAVADYARVLIEDWKRRQVIAAGEEIVGLAFSRDVGADDVVSGAMAKLEGAFGAEADVRSFSLNEALDAALQSADEASRRQGPAGLSTGFRRIDEHLGGLEDGTLNILGGRPGMGKTALAVQIAVNNARQGVGVLMVSLEMSALELGRRVLAFMSGVPVWAMKRGRMTDEQVSSLIVARKELHGLPMTIEDGSGLSAAVIDLKARAAHRKHGLGLMVVDHLHIVRPEDADLRSGATWAVGRISGAMKRMAKTHRIPVLLLAQLNRGVEGRDDKRPALQDLRQAGDIEQDADVVSFVYRAEYYLGKSEPERAEGEAGDKYHQRVEAWHERKRALAGKAEIIFAKVRDGETGTVPLTFHGETTSFSEASVDGF